MVARRLGDVEDPRRIVEYWETELDTQETVMDPVSLEKEAGNRPKT